MMRVRKVVRNIGIWGAGVAIAAALGVSGAPPALAEEIGEHDCLQGRIHAVEQ